MDVGRVVGFPFCAYCLKNIFFQLFQLFNFSILSIRTKQKKPSEASLEAGLPNN
jgi:hypothetical protein